MDLLLDALSYEADGRWSSFVRLSRQINDAPWFPFEAGRRLSALAHIDLALDEVTLRPTSWGIAPTCLVKVAGGAAVLSGARSERLVARLRSDVESLGGDLAIERVEGAPSIVLVRGADDDLELLALSLSDVTGNPVPLVPDLPAQMLELLPPVSQVASVLPTMNWPAIETEIYSPQVGWTRADSSRGEGAYRLLSTPLRFGVVRRGERQMRSSDSRLAKVISTVDAGVPVIAFDQVREILTARRSRPCRGCMNVSPQCAAGCFRAMTGTSCTTGLSLSR